MEYKQLINFIKVAEYNNFSKAAAELFVSQPALSQSITKLEDELGARLFDRKGKKIEINPLGVEILKQAEQIVWCVDTMHRCVEEYLEKDNESISIVIKAGSPIIFQLLNEYHELYSDIGINILLHENSKKAEVRDIIIDTSLEECEDNTGLSIVKEKLVAALPCEHPLSKKKYINMEDLAEEMFISLNSSYELRKILDYWCDMAGFRLKISVESDDASVVRNWIKTGKGISVIPSISWNTMEDEAIVIKEIKNPECYRYINAHFLSGENNKKAYDLYKYIVSNAARIAEKHHGNLSF